MNLFYRIFCLLILFITCSCQQDINKETEGFIDIQDSKIHYKISGEGDLIIFLHGGYLNLDSWDRQAEAFSKEGYQVARFSDLGHGETINGSTAVSSQEIISRLIGICGKNRASLVGLSWGGTLAVDFTLQHPDRVHKLVLVSAGIKEWDWYQDTLANDNAKLRAQYFEQSDTAKVAEYFHNNWVIGPRRSKDSINQEVSEKMYHTIYNTFRKHWGESWSTLDTLPLQTRLTHLNTPTLFLLAEHDVRDIHQIAQKYQSQLPNFQLLTIDGTAHMINLELPEVFQEVVLNFLGKK